MEESCIQTRCRIKEQAEKIMTKLSNSDKVIVVTSN